MTMEERRKNSKVMEKEREGEKGKKENWTDYEKKVRKEGRGRTNEGKGNVEKGKDRMVEG